MSDSEYMDGFADIARYFGDHDIDGMFATLTPLHDDLGRVSTYPHRMSGSMLILQRDPRRSEKYLLFNHLAATFKRLSIGAISIVKLMS